MPVDPDDLIDAFQASVEEQTRQALRLSAEMEDAAVTMTSPGGEITVRINSAGGLTDLKFHQESDRLSRDDLARLVLGTSQRAQAELAKRVGELVAGVYGPGSSTAAWVEQVYSSRYPELNDDHGGAS